MTVFPSFPAHPCPKRPGENAAGIAADRQDTVAHPTADAFRRAMRLLSAHVSIVAAGTDTGLTGMTVTSVASLSLAPPAVSLAVATTASIHPVLAASRRFGLSGLTPAHRRLADRFAGRDGIAGAERFADGRWAGLASGSPTLTDAVFALDCTVERMIGWYSHSIVIGRVRRVRIGAPGSTDGGSLVYENGDYCAVAALE